MDHYTMNKGNDIVPLKGVTRFEVIDHRPDAPEQGRVLVATGTRVTVSLQDGGKTMKVFLS